MSLLGMKFISLLRLKFPLLFPFLFMLVTLPLALASCGETDTTTAAGAITTAAATKTAASSIQPLFKSSEFTDPSVCGGCHKEIYAQWQGSMHNNAFADQFYLKMHDEASHDTGGAVDSFCTRCPTPIGTFSGEVPPTSGSRISEISKQGVQCDFCHTVTNLNITFMPSKVKRGPFSDAVSPFHETAYSELHTKSDFCGMCHNVNHPDNQLPLEATYTEWKNSPYAAQGIQCQDCHMTPGPGVTKPNPDTAASGGPARPHIYTHQFVGGNATPLASSGHQQLAREQLQAAAAIEVALPSGVKTGSSTELLVTVKNKGAGHYLPTGLTEVREMWLDVIVTDAGGNIVFHSGSIDENGMIDPQAVLYQTTFKDKDGNPTHKPWLAVETLSDHRVPPQGSLTESYKVPVPADASLPLTMQATRRYRPAPQPLVDDLLGKGTLVLPVIDMANTKM